MSFSTLWVNNEYLRGNAGLCSDCIPASELPVSKKLWGEELGKFRGVHLMSLLILFHISVPAVQKFLEKKLFWIKSEFPLSLKLLFD